MNNTAWQRARREAVLRAVRIHDLRHAFACSPTCRWRIDGGSRGSARARQPFDGGPPRRRSSINLRPPLAPQWTIRRMLLECSAPRRADGDRVALNDIRRRASEIELIAALPDRPGLRVALPIRQGLCWRGRIDNDLQLPLLTGIERDLVERDQPLRWSPRALVGAFALILSAATRCVIAWTTSTSGSLPDLGFRHVLSHALIARPIAL